MMKNAGINLDMILKKKFNMKLMNYMTYKLKHHRFLGICALFSRTIEYQIDTII